MWNITKAIASDFLYLDGIFLCNDDHLQSDVTALLDLFVNDQHYLGS